MTDVKLAFAVDGKRVFSERGKLLFTHTGLSGPTILNMSKRVSDLLETGAVEILIGLLPEFDEGGIRKKLTTTFHERSNQTVRNTLKTLVPTSLATVLLTIANIKPDTPCHSVRVQEKHVLAALLFELPVTITGLMGEDKAIISAGGVDVTEINFKTMESTKTPGLYLVGDMLDIDRPSGGYSLQLCWSTGYVAGLHAAK